MTTRETGLVAGSPCHVYGVTQFPPRPCTCTPEERQRMNNARFCAECSADILGNEPHAEGCPKDGDPR